MAPKPQWPTCGSRTVDEAGDALRAVLSDANIRSTTADAGRGRVRVLVFAADLEQARALVGPGAW